MKTVSFTVILSVLFVSTVIASLFSLSIGSVNIPLGKIVELVSHPESNSVFSQIIFDIRLPRVLLAIAVGGGLSVAGAVFQALLMNPLAEPYILGISSGGTFGAVLSFLIGASFLTTQVFAFSGSIVVVFLVFILGKRYGEIEPNVLLLTGIMIGAFFSAAILFMLTMLNDSLRQAIFWLMGNLSLATPESVQYVLPVTIVISFLLSLNGQKYNVLSLGTDSAKHLGVNTRLLTNYTYIIASIMVGAIVSVSGIVGFVGLLVPHICRMIFGIDNRIVVPASFFLGATYLIISDTIARNLIAPAELPVGTITALIGAPLFIYLLKKRFSAIS
ncbi:MAG: iron ABC transporter permease [Bacteroidetes bacterium]|nr:iron ABC transporter permease [Bacteroidota bacterium]